jgi:excisionase family DNA binding protein
MNDFPIRPHLLTIRQVAVIIQVHEKTVRNYIEEGKLKGHNPNGKRNGATGLRVTVESVREYLKKFELDEFNEDEFNMQLQKISIPSRRRIISSGIEQLS